MMKRFDERVKQQEAKAAAKRQRAEDAAKMNNENDHAVPQQTSSSSVDAPTKARRGRQVLHFVYC
jgi:hypothetical protein